MFLSCQQNIEYFKKRLNNNEDVLSKTLFIAEKEIAILYIKSIINEQLLTDMILTPLISKDLKEISVDIILSNILTTASEEKIEQTEQSDMEIVEGVLKGKVALFVEGENSCILIDIEEVPMRMPSEPPTSAVLYGPRVGFTENAKQKSFNDKKNDCHRQSHFSTIPNWQIYKNNGGFMLFKRCG